MEKYLLPLPEPKKFCLLGAGVALQDFIIAFAKANARRYEFFVVTEADLDERWSGAEGPKTQELCEKNGCDLVVVPPGDAAEIARAASERHANIAVVLGWNAILPKRVLDIFQSRIFNFHPVRLPGYRGPGGGFSWQVLDQETTVYINFHIMTTIIDAGDIVLENHRDFGRPFQNPQEYVDAMSQLCNSEVFPHFSKILVEDPNVSAWPQDHFLAEYFPRLETAINGAIDFAWTADEILRFVRAFGSPYAGASFLYLRRRYSVRQCEVIRRDDAVHPFGYGLIVNRFNDAIQIRAKGGLLALSEFSDETGAHVDPTRFRLGNRFYNDAQTLLSSKIHRPT